MYCTNCGSPLPDGALTCENCGSPVITAEQNQQQNPYSYQPEPQQQNYQYQQPVYQQPYQNYDPTSASEISSAKTFGTVSVILSVMGIAIIGLICGIIGLNKAKPYYVAQYNSEAESAYKWNKAGIVISIIRMVLALLIVVLAFMGAVNGERVYF